MELCNCNQVNLQSNGIGSDKVNFRLNMLSAGWIGFIVVGIIGSTFPLLFGLVLYILGFGCIGITAGTCAAAMMSFIPLLVGQYMLIFSLHILLPKATRGGNRV